jgi:hypothetical protein
VSFPEWGIDHVEAKVDTGAKTRALHVDNIGRMPGNRVSFEVVLSRKDPIKRVPASADIVRVSRVRSSTGHRQERFVVSTTVQIGSERRIIETSLACRRTMLCRMLLGRTALTGFLIDVALKHEQGVHKRLRRKGPGK